MSHSLRSLLEPGQTLLLPGAYDAMCARMVEDAGFRAYGIGGAAVACTQAALPDAGLVSFGEYRDSVARVMSGSKLPVLVDGENGFGDAKATARTVRSFEALGVGGLTLEDLRFPPKIGQPTAVISIDEMSAKLEGALKARSSTDMMIVGRSDAVGAVGLEEAMRRIARYEQVGVDAVLVTGMKSRDELGRVRDCVKVPIVAVIREGGSWTPTPRELATLGYEMALYPATLMLRAMTSLRDALQDIRNGVVALPGSSLNRDDVAKLVKADDWAQFDGPVKAN